MVPSRVWPRALKLPPALASLRYRNYRLWFGGPLASLMGTWMQATAQGFLVFQLTHSAACLGYVGFAAGVPSLLLMLCGGVVSDRISQRSVLLVTQTSMMALAFIQAGLTFTGAVQPWMIIALAFALGIANAFDAPARQALVLEMVRREDLSNAVALNSTMFNLATVVGPALGGIIYALLGPAWCFAVNGFSFLPVIAALGLMSVPPARALRSRSSPGRDLQEGVGYVASHATVLVLVVVSGVTAILGQGCITLLPAWSVDVLQGGATINGWLQSARGLGCVLGALLIASLGRFRFKGRLLTIGTLVFPVFIVAFSLVRQFLPALLAMVGFGLGMMILFNMINAILLGEPADVMRGRVMSFYTLSTVGLVPLGALATGAAANRVGEPLTVLISGVLLLAFAAVLWLRAPRMRKLESALLGLAPQARGEGPSISGLPARFLWS